MISIKVKIDQEEGFKFLKLCEKNNLSTCDMFEKLIKSFNDSVNKTR